MKKIALIGSSGSIGQQTLNVVRRNPDKFEIVSLSAGSNFSLFKKQVEEFSPKVATLAVSPQNQQFNEGEYKKTEFYFGENAFTNAIIDEADIVVIALVGFKGIIAVIDAIKKGKNIALANKESLVVGGEIVMKLAKEKGVSILPIDSEHSAIWQALDFDFNKPFNKIILTASGGAFRDLTAKEIKHVKASDALKHPTWQMGAKITIDCATLVNKAFEVIEAKWLYNSPLEKIDVIIHRESIIHSMVEFKDKSTIAQLSYPTMEVPIALALTYPQRINSAINSLDFAKIGKLTFDKVDVDRFPCFNLILSGAKKGGVYPAIVNGANECAVNLFLQDKIAFTDIYKAIIEAINNYKDNFDTTIDGLICANDYAVLHTKKLFGV